MKNKVVEKYLNNFALINTEGMEAFAREQSKLLSPDLVASTTDYRGTLTEHGIGGFFRGLQEWSKHFESNHHSRKQFVEDTPTRVSVRVLNRLGLVVPVDGRTVSEEDEHEWTEEFEVGPNGLITRVHVSVILNPRPSLPPERAGASGQGNNIREENQMNTASKVVSGKGHAEPMADLGREAVQVISGQLRRLLADVFALYLKTKNFHWHMTGRHFRDYHLLLDEQAKQIFAMTDTIAERARKLGSGTLRSIGEISREQRLRDNDRETLSAEEMLSDLRMDSRELTRFLRLAHETCERYNDVATASLIEVWIDETERRTWFLTEVVGNN